MRSSIKKLEKAFSDWKGKLESYRLMAEIESPEGKPCEHCGKGRMTEEPVDDDRVRREALAVRGTGFDPLLYPGDRPFVCSEKCGYVWVLRKKVADVR